MKILFFVLSLFFCLVLSGAVCNTVVCCASSCANCTICISGNSTNNALCCQNNILAANLSCSTNPVPCVGNIITSQSSTFEQFLAFMSIPNIVFLSICGAIFLAMIYACTCFDNRKPPLQYSDITWSEGTSWVKEE